MPDTCDPSVTRRAEEVVPIMDVLARNGYKGYYCFEWEKRWHPDIDEPEVSFPHYAKTMRQYLAEFGVKK